MSIVTHPTFVEFPQYWIIVAWGDKQVRLVFTWRERVDAWYLDIYDLAESQELSDDTPIVLGRRISPRFMPLLGLTLEELDYDVLPVVTGAEGADPYRRADFGESVELLLVDRDDLPAAAADGAADLVITIPP